MIAEGDAFLLPLSGTNVKHLYVVISDPVLDKEHVVIVNVSTWEDGEDDACFLGVEEWGEQCPFIRHDSYVRYRSARLVAASKIEEWLAKSIATERRNVGPALLEAIRRGAEETRFLPNKCCLALNDQGLIEM